jgi:MoaA/NifB/PqqE/SkfB family radical SAM enzyme
LFDSVTVSLDGTSPETYLRIRGVDAFGKVCEGVEAVANLGVPTSLRVTLQQANYRELDHFVGLARDLGAAQVSFLAVDVGNPHAFAREDDYVAGLALDERDVAELRALVTALEAERAEAFQRRFIAESPARLHRICDYFAAVCGLREFPETRCNAPEFSAVVGAEGRVSPCFFIAGPVLAPRAPALQAALASDSMKKLRATIRSGGRAECERCVCSMWRDPESVSIDGFSLRGAGNA